MRKINEIWRPIPSRPGYEASNLGRIKSCARRVRFLDKIGREHFRLKKEKIIKSGPHHGGYRLIRFADAAKSVHSLVAEAFLGPRPIKFDVCHLNGKRDDNRLENLRYAARKENCAHRLSHGTYYASATQAKLNAKQIEFILKNSEKSNGELAKLFGVTPETVRRVKKGETWKHLTNPTNQ